MYVTADSKEFSTEDALNGEFIYQAPEGNSVAIALLYAKNMKIKNSNPSVSREQAILQLITQAFIIRVAAACEKDNADEQEAVVSTLALLLSSVAIGFGVKTEHFQPMLGDIILRALEIHEKATGTSDTKH